MSQLYDPAKQTSFFATNRYPTSNNEATFMGLTGKRNEEMRAMTIAAFRVAQNETYIDDRIMDGNLLYFLVGNSDTAIDYWIREGRLDEGEGGYYLTQLGLEECARSLNGVTRGYNVSEGKVREWVNRMLNGDVVTTETYTR